MAGWGTQGVGPIFVAGMLVYRSGVSLDKKILFGNVHHLTDQEIRKMLGTNIPRSILVHDLPSIETRNVHLYLLLSFLSQ